jgi:acyl transferase domain-containing protein
LAGLDALVAGEPAGNLISGRAETGGGVCFVFSGQGAQWPGMSGELLAGSEVFRCSIEACSEAMGAHADWSLLEMLKAPDDPLWEVPTAVQATL